MLFEQREKLEKEKEDVKKISDELMYLTLKEENLIDAIRKAHPSSSEFMQIKLKADFLNSRIKSFIKKLDDYPDKTQTWLMWEETAKNILKRTEAIQNNVSEKADDLNISEKMENAISIEERLSNLLKIIGTR